MKRIEKHYNKLVKKFHKIETETTENEIHDKRVILRRVFPILGFFKIKSSKVKFGATAFVLFGKLRDIQVQIMKLERISQPQEWMEYLQYLKELELKYIKKVTKFSKKKVVEFPSLKTSKMNGCKINGKVHAKVNNNFNKLLSCSQLPTLEKADDIHKIRIAFKKFRYTVEVLSYIEDIDAGKLEKLKNYQDELGEIQDWKVLINGITKFYRKKALIIDEKIAVFEVEKDQRIEHFRNEKENFIEVCKDIISQKHITQTDDYEQERH